jgi:hypothetical protein
LARDPLAIQFFPGVARINLRPWWSCKCCRHILRDTAANIGNDYTVEDVWREISSGRWIEVKAVTRHVFANNVEVRGIKLLYEYDDLAIPRLSIQGLCREFDAHRSTDIHGKRLERPREGVAAINSETIRARQNRLLHYDRITGHCPDVRALNDDRGFERICVITADITDGKRYIEGIVDVHAGLRIGNNGIGTSTLRVEACGAYRINNHRVGTYSLIVEIILHAYINEHERALEHSCRFESPRHCYG